MKRVPLQHEQPASMCEIQRCTPLPSQNLPAWLEEGVDPSVYQARDAVAVFSAEFGSLTSFT